MARGLGHGQRKGPAGDQGTGPKGPLLPSSPPAQALPLVGWHPGSGDSHLPSSHKAWAGRQGYQGGASSGLRTGQDPTSLAPGDGGGRARAQARPRAASWSGLSEARGTGGGTSPTSCPVAVPGAPGASWPPWGLPRRSGAGAVGSSRQPSATAVPGRRWAEAAQPPGAPAWGAERRLTRLPPGLPPGDRTRAARGAPPASGPHGSPAVAVRPRPVSGHARLPWG